MKLFQTVHLSSRKGTLPLGLSQKIRMRGQTSVLPWLLQKNTALLTNFPNPFNPETWIPFQLATPSDVTITIYDIRGRIVRTLILGNQPAGTYQSRSKAAHWDGRNHFGEKVATGVYFYTLKAGIFLQRERCWDASKFQKNMEGCKITPFHLII